MQQIVLEMFLEKKKKKNKIKVIILLSIESILMLFFGIIQLHFAMSIPGHNQAGYLIAFYLCYQD